MNSLSVCTNSTRKFLRVADRKRGIFFSAIQRISSKFRMPLTGGGGEQRWRIGKLAILNSNKGRILPPKGNIFLRKMALFGASPSRCTLKGSRSSQLGEFGIIFSLISKWRFTKAPDDPAIESGQLSFPLHVKIPTAATGHKTSNSFATDTAK